MNVGTSPGDAWSANHKSLPLEQRWEVCPGQSSRKGILWAATATVLINSSLNNDHWNTNEQVTHVFCSCDRVSWMIVQPTAYHRDLCILIAIINSEIHLTCPVLLQLGDFSDHFLLKNTSYAPP